MAKTDVKAEISAINTHIKYIRNDQKDHKVKIEALSKDLPNEVRAIVKDAIKEFKDMQTELIDAKIKPCENGIKAIWAYIKPFSKRIGNLEMTKGKAIAVVAVVGSIITFIVNFFF